MPYLIFQLCELAGLLHCELAVRYAALLTTFAALAHNVLCIFSSVNYNLFVVCIFSFIAKLLVV